MQTFKIIAGFIFLDLYFMFLPGLIGLEGVTWVLFALSAFVLIHYIAKWLALDGLQSFGYRFHPGWSKNFGLGMLIGAGTWGLLYTAYFAAGIHQVTGVASLSEIPWILVQAMVLSFLGSTINDAITRGYWFANLKGKWPTWALIGFTSLVYALDDAWNEGLNLYNTLFSLLLGFALSYAFARTKSIWATTGMHMGLNLVHWSLMGVPGGIGLVSISHNAGGLLAYLISLTAAVVMLVLAVWAFKASGHDSGLDNLISG